MEAKRFCVPENSTIFEVMNVIESIRERGVIAVNENGKVIGIITLGDIVGALAGGFSMYSLAGKIINTSYIYLKEFDLRKAFDLFQERNLSLIPVLNEDFELAGVITPREVMRKAKFDGK